MKFHFNISENRLTFRLILYILLYSSIITTLITFIQLYLDYRLEISLLEKLAQDVEKSQLSSLAQGLWREDKEYVQTGLEGISHLSGIKYAEVRTTEGVYASSGEKSEQWTTTYEFPMKHTFKGQEFDMGILSLKVDLQTIYLRLLDKLLVILVSQSFKTFLVSIFILYIVHRLIIRHLMKISRYTQVLNADGLDDPLELVRPSQKKQDELDDVADSINNMRVQLKDDIQARKQVEGRLEKLNQELEQRVKERTQELKEQHTLLEEKTQILVEKDEQIQQDLKVAAEIQSTLFSKQLQAPFLKLAVRFHPCSQVSGDIYYFRENEHSVDVFLGDATGHGVSAAFITIMTHMVLEEADEHKSVSDIMKQLNTQLYFHTPAHLFMTGLYLRITNQGLLQIVGAGHPPAVIFPANGEDLTLAKIKEPVLGVFHSKASYQIQTFSLNHGDKILLYTDGCYEHKPLGFKQFVSILPQYRSLEVEAFADRLLEQMNEYSKDGLDDDLTIILLEYQSGK